MSTCHDELFVLHFLIFFIMFHFLYQLALFQLCDKHQFPYTSALCRVVSGVGSAAPFRDQHPIRKRKAPVWRAEVKGLSFAPRLWLYIFLMQNGALWIWMCPALYISLFETEHDFKKKRLKWSVWNTWLIFIIHRYFTFVAVFIVLIHPQMNQEFHYYKQAFE